MLDQLLCALAGAALGRLAGEVLDAIVADGINGHFIGAGGYAVVGEREGGHKGKM